MGNETVINLDGLMDILWKFLNRCEIRWKRFKHAINVVGDV